MANIRFALCAGLACVIGLACALQGPKAGAKAPSFKAQGTDGKSHDLAELTKKGDLFLYFIKIGCPVNHRAAPHFNSVAKAYDGKSNLVGVINGSVQDAKKWAQEYGAKFLILADPDMKIIRSYGAVYSPWAIAVSGGKIAKVWEGGDPQVLTDLNKRAAKRAGTKLVAMSFDGAPSGGG